MAKNLPATQSGGLPSALNTATLSPNVVKAEGAGSAYQAVAQATAIAVQDAASYVRNIEIVAATTAGVAAAKIVQGVEGDPEVPNVAWLPVVEAALTWVNTAAGSLTTVGTDAGNVLKNFPSG